MARYLVTKEYVWAVEVEAESPEEAEQKANAQPMSGEEIIQQGHRRTTVALMETGENPLDRR